MRWVAALLAVALLGAGVAACGGGGAEPGAPQGATLVLDFQPNAVHSGIYAAEANGYFELEGVDLTIREPSSTADSAKLLETGRADLAIMDINDFGIASERGANLVPLAAIVQSPLASVITGDRDAIRTPAELAGKTIGVTGVPSDEAVLDSVLRSAGLDPSDARRVTIGFNAVSALAAGKVDAATAFWNAEGVTLKREGIATRTFRVDDFGAPRYPELVLVTTRETLQGHPDLVNAVVQATTRGYALAARQPKQALADLLAADPSLQQADQAAELGALNAASAFRGSGEFDWAVLRHWARWDAEHGIVTRPPDFGRTFARLP